MFISNLKVVNDVAGKGENLVEEFKDILTDDEEHRKMLLHCAKDLQKRYLDFRKSTLAEKNKIIIASNRDRFLYHCVNVEVRSNNCKGSSPRKKTEEPELRATP